MVSVLVGLEVPAWGRVAKDSILSGWGSRLTHDADIGEGLTDGRSCEAALSDPSLAPGPPALQGQDGNENGVFSAAGLGPPPAVKINPSTLHPVRFFSEEKNA